MIKLYNIAKSGNCHKIRLLLSFLGLEYTVQNLDIATGEQHRATYRQLNPFAQAPVLDDDGVVIRDSQAILVYLASKYGGGQWWPESCEQLAQVTAWLSTAANEITHGPALLRAYYLIGREINLKAAQKITDKVLAIIQEHLIKHQWLANNRFSIADISVYPYLALAHQGKVDIDQYPNIRAWCTRFESQPNYISMPGILLTNQGESNDN